MSRRLPLIFALVLLLGRVVAAKPTRAVILPTGLTGRDAAESKIVSAVERALVEAARKIPAIEIANLDGAKLRSAHAEAKADPRPQARAQALAHELSAELAILAETQPLGEGAVVYLQVLEAAGRSRGSTTVAISSELLKGGDSEAERPLRGGLTQVLDPARFVGRVELHIDVKGAEVEVDGGKVSAKGTIELPVGPHAVRVTHPAYRDFLRFVEVGFDRTSVESVALAAFPLTEGEMAEKQRRGPVTVRRVPWYRSWWALTLSGVVLVGATSGIVFATRPSLTADHETHYAAKPAP